MEVLKAGDMVKVTLIQTEYWQSPMSFSGGIVSEILDKTSEIRIHAEFNKVQRHTFNCFGSGRYSTNAYLIEKI